jgi:hypothetical protein
MTDPYPIVARRVLDLAKRRGLFGLGPRRRDFAELPPVHAHQTLVYRVGGQLVVDSGSYEPWNQVVVNATHVSVVDLRRNAPVTVQFVVPAADAASFTVNIVFLCTVTDPVTVVRDGLLDVSHSLTAYLRSHQRLFQVGIPYQVTDLNDMRRVMTAQIKAYTTVKPPAVAGMQIVLAGVEVLAPEELAGFETERLKLMLGESLNLERVALQHRLDEYRQQHELALAQGRRAYERGELEQAAALIGDDPRRALLLAFAAGQLDAQGLAEWLRRDLAADRDVEAARVEWRREDERLAREDRRELAQLEREERLRLDALDREMARRQLDAQVDIIRQLAQRGHLDMVSIDVERLVEHVVAGSLPRTLPTLPAGVDDREDPQDAEVREEDDD